MPTGGGWVKSLQCKSKAVDDVVPHNHHRRRRLHRISNPNHHHHSLSHSSSCRNSVQSLKDIIIDTTKPKPPKPPHQTPVQHPVRTRFTTAEPSFFPSLTELPAGHPSRNVVEIIFHTSWGEKGNFTAQVEMVFKIQNPTRTVTRFEDYRETVKSRAGSTHALAGEDHARCVADGNEVMRFYCLGAVISGGGAYEVGCGAWALYGGKGAAVCTFSGSGVAHERGGGGRGRRAMLVCRVIAGRVWKQPGCDSLVGDRVGYDSVSGENGELLVFDSRALLPCFLIIYTL